jgi:hypothetical protein
MPSCRLGEPLGQRLDLHDAAPPAATPRVQLSVIRSKRLGVDQVSRRRAGAAFSEMFGGPRRKCVLPASTPYVVVTESTKTEEFQMTTAEFRFPGSESPSDTIPPTTETASCCST